MTTKIFRAHIANPRGFRGDMDPSLRSGLKLTALVLLLLCLSCNKASDSDTLVVIIENSPVNLDPRVGTDAQSQFIGELIFDSLVHKDEHFNLGPGAAESWEIPDPQTYVFHLRHGMQFHDGRPLIARDVKWTLDSMLSGAVPSAKTSTYRLISRIDAPDDYTVVIHLSEPFAGLPWNLSEGA